MARRGFEVRGLPDSDLDHYDCLAREHGCVFNTVDWTDLFGDSLTRYGIYDAGGTLRGGFCLYREKRLGLTVLRNPPFTPEIGPFFESRTQHPVARLEEWRGVLTVLADFLEHLHPAVVSLSLAQAITDCLPFIWRRFRVAPRYTYRLASGQSDESLLAGMTARRREELRQARRDGFVVEQARDYSVVAALARTSLGRQGVRQHQQLDVILLSFARPENSYAYVASHGNTPIAAAFVIHDRATAYYLLSGYRADMNHQGAVSLAAFEAIRHARTLALQTFDFEGSTIHTIERHLRAFGGKLTPYYGVSKAWLPLEMALKLFKRNLF